MSNDRSSAIRSETRADPSSTVELVERAQQGDRSALDRLFARHAVPLRRWAHGRLPTWARDLTDTDDLVQEALLQTFKRIGEFETRGTGALYAYLRQAVFNRIRDEFRRRARRPDFIELDGGREDGGTSPLEQAIGREALERYERALARLKPQEQEAVIARVEMGYTYDELAESLGKPSPTPPARRRSARSFVWCRRWSRTSDARRIDDRGRCRKRHGFRPPYLHIPPRYHRAERTSSSLDNRTSGEIA